MNNIKKMIKNHFLSQYVNYAIQNLRYIKLISFDIIKLFLGKVRLNKPSGMQKNKPKTIQFPVTHNCNLRCKTCNVYSDKGEQISVKQVKKIVKDNFFSEIISVGINGGEPFLLSNIEDYIGVILTLPKIKNINIISNGVLKKIILEKMEIIYQMCSAKGVKLGFTTSIDGYREIHDNIRGLKGAFDKTIGTYMEIKKNRHKYCDNYGIICTISKFNIYYINDLLAYFQLNNITRYSFQLAVKHKRLHNYEIPSFSVMDDHYTRMLAQEFFYSLFINTKENKYYFIYDFLRNNANVKRKSVCKYMDENVTIDGNGNLAYCATASKTLGHVDSNDYMSIFFKKSNLRYRNEIIKSTCDSCIHYTSNNGYLKANFEAYKELKSRSTWNYKFYKRWSAKK